MYPGLTKTDLFLHLGAKHQHSAAYFLISDGEVSELLKTDAEETERDEGLSIMSFFLVAANLLIFLASLQGHPYIADLFVRS